MTKATTKAGPRDATAARTETLAPARNFTIPLAERVRALNGPPAYVTRKRTIEDLHAALVDAIAGHVAEGDAAALAEALAKRAFRTKLARLNALIEAHNRYYPCEANLPMDPRTGAMLERGVPWKPLPLCTTDALIAIATRA